MKSTVLIGWFTDQRFDEIGVENVHGTAALVRHLAGAGHGIGERPELDIPVSEKCDPLHDASIRPAAAISRILDQRRAGVNGIAYYL